MGRRAYNSYKNKVNIKKEINKRFKFGRDNDQGYQPNFDEEAKTPAGEEEEKSGGMFNRGKKLIGAAGKSLKKVAGKVSISKGKEDEDPTRYSVLPSKGDTLMNGPSQEDTHKRIWTKDGAVMVQKGEEYPGLNADRQREVIKSSVVKERAEILDEAIDEAQLDDGTYDPYANTGGEMRLDDDL